ncbi:MAG: Asp-tRNA(Asn)/Glu-tRNA(Gln) amidotransferase subunit GatA [Firmicutes bacterium]|nr:Asp-tRNA(Asn)/Glu-tRNA(Gln) amidotransferase subunit GatA [Bacillota bacterium]
MSQITSYTVTQLISQKKQGLTSLDITLAYLERIKASGNNAYITVTEEQALRQAKEADARTDAGDLSGIPCAIKDNICTKGIRTTCASRMLESFVPPYSATVAEKLNAAGCVTLGKLNMDEFAMGSSTETSYFGPTLNPRNTLFVPGGSSGGSAAAVAACEAPFALGSDTGGSIRQPAAFCGVVGMKPTYGRVSRNGLVAFASSLDQIGPITRCVQDNALILDSICGLDPMDSTSLDSPADCSSDIGKDIKGLRVALPPEFLSHGVSDEVRSAILNAAHTLEALGAVVTQEPMPSLQYALPAYYVISSAEASSNLARFDGVKYGYRTKNFESIDDIYKNSRSEGFGSEVKRRIMLGSFVLSAGYRDAYYKKALSVRTAVINDFKRVFSKCDCILSPVAPTAAWKLGQHMSDPMAMYMADVFTVPVNIAGLPALSLPCGIGAGSLPIGAQLIGDRLSERLLYRCGYALEQALNITFDKEDKSR